MIAVIADDITGAAELAGIGFRYGLTIRFVLFSESGRLVLSEGGCQPLSESEQLDDNLLVCATDTRSMTAEAAVETTRRVARELQQLGIRHLFKKTDSALRGHIVEELHALLEETDYRNALLLPENPSRGRIIKDGIYYIKETPLATKEKPLAIKTTPLAETNFAFDPEFPALTSSVAERFPETINVPAFSPSTPFSFSSTDKSKIFMADAVSEQDVTEALRQCPADTLPAGAADLFTAYLEKQGHRPVAPPAFQGLGTRNAIIVCGSTQSTPLDNTPYCQRKNIRSCTMPHNIFKGTAAPNHWIDALIEEYTRQGSLLLTIGHPSEGGKAFAQRLRETIAAAVCTLTDHRPPQELIIEGGATAFSILAALGSQQFTITNEVAPGVIRMQSETGMYVTLKPGSYPWGNLLL